MNNIDLKFNEEFETVQENVHKLVVGNKYKYADLMTILGLPVKKSKGRETQTERIKQYINWDSKTKIYNGLKKENNTPMVKKTTRSEYYEPTSYNFMAWLSDSIKENPTLRVLTISHTKALEVGGFVSEGYKYSRNKIGLEYTSEYTKLPKETINAYNDKLRRDGLPIIESTLRQLDKQKIIVFNKAVVFITYKRDNNGNIIKHITKDGRVRYEPMYRNSTTVEQVYLGECKNKVLKEMYPSERISNRMYLAMVNHKYDIFEKKVIKMLDEEYGIFIDKFYCAYEIGIIKDKVNKEFDTLERLNNEILVKNKICKKMLNSREKQYREAISKCCSVKDGYRQAVTVLGNVMVHNDHVYLDGLLEVIDKAELSDSIQRMYGEQEVLKSKREHINKEFDKEEAILKARIENAQAQLK